MIHLDDDLVLEITDVVMDNPYFIDFKWLDANSNFDESDIELDEV